VGWAGLSPKGLGRSRPNSPLCFCWSGPDPTQTSGLGQNRPDLEKKNRGGLFPPSHPPACRTVFVLHVGGDKAKIEVKAGGKKSYLARRRRCLAGLAEVVTYEQKLRAAVLLFQTTEREVTALPLSYVFSPLLLLCFHFFLFFSICFFFHLPFLFLFQSRPSHLSLTVPLPCFKLPRLLSFFSLSSPLFSFLSVFSPLFFFSPFFLCWR